MDLYSEIARVAHELWDKRGRAHGGDCEDWYQAEIIVRARYAKSGTGAQEAEKQPAKPEKAVPKKPAKKATRGTTKGPAKTKPSSSRK